MSRDIHAWVESKVVGIDKVVVMECKVALFRSNLSLHTYGKHHVHLNPRPSAYSSFLFICVPKFEE